MRIPDPYFAGLGRRPEPVPNAPDAVYPSGQGEQAIADAGARIGQNLFQLATDETEYQGRMELTAAHQRRQEAERLLREQDDEAKHLEKVKAHGEAQTSLFDHENTLGSVAETIAKAGDLTPTEKLQQFDEQAGNVLQSFNGKVPEEYRYAFGPAFEQQRLKMRDGLVKQIATDEQHVIRGQLTDAMEALKRTSQPLGVKLELVNDLEWEKAGFKPDEQAKAVQAFREGVTADAVAEQFNTAGPKQVLAELTARQGEDGPYANYQYLEPKSREALIQTARHQIDAQRREEERLRREAERARKEDARDAYDLYKDAKEGLLPLDTKGEAALLRRMAGTDYFKRAKAVQARTSSIGFELEKIKADPLTFGSARLGLTVAPLDPRQADAWPQQLAARGQVAGQIKAKYGLAFLPVLTNQEAKGLADLMQTQTPTGIVRTVESMATIPGMKGNTMKQVAVQLAQADPQLGMVVGLTASGRSDAALAVANGQRIIKEKGLPTSGKKGFTDDMGARFQGLIQDAVSHNPPQKEAIGQAVNAAYVSMAASEGKLDGKLDKSIYDKAFRMVAGEPVKINGKRVLIPSGMSEGQFKTFFNRLSGETVKSAGGVAGFADPVTAAAAIRDDGKLYEMGDGRYKVTIGDRYLQTTDGRDFVISIGSHW